VISAVDLNWTFRARKPNPTSKKTSSPLKSFKEKTPLKSVLIKLYKREEASTKVFRIKEAGCSPETSINQIYRPHG